MTVNGSKGCTAEIPLNLPGSYITFLLNSWSLNSHGYNNVHNRPIYVLLVPSTSGSNCKAHGSEKNPLEMFQPLCQSQPSAINKTRYCETASTKGSNNNKNIIILRIKYL